MINYCDLCYVNTRVDYRAMKAAGITCAYIKLGQPGLGIDPMFDAHRAGIIEAGVMLGFYFFADYRLTGAQNAGSLMDMLAQVGYNPPVLPILPLMLDVEYEERLGWGRPSPASMLMFTLNVFEHLTILNPGHDMIRTVFYSNPDMFVPFRGLPGIEELTRHPLAVAHWNAADPIVGPWPTWSIWQTNGDISVKWADQKVDLGTIRPVTLAAWDSSGDWSPGITVPPAPIPFPPAPALDFPTRDQAIDDMLRKAGYTWQG